MPDDQTVVDHLLRGRQALETEVDRHSAEIQRLTSAIDQLDSVIGMVGPTDGAASSAPGRVAPLTRAPAAVTVNTSPSSDTSTSAPAGASTRKPAVRARKPRGAAPKSIRVHVLEMLAAEDREWSLAEIIERIHGAGVQAHDDAVRSITIKLMKDGRVERVGRGQYRLARRGAARSVAATTTVPAAAPAAPAVDEADVVADELPVESASDESETIADDTITDDTMTDDTIADDTVTDDTVETDADFGPVTEVESGEPEVDEPSFEQPPADEPETRPYSPPLNLGQPWG